MKSVRIGLSALCVALLCLLSACQTFVNVRYLRPADVNLGNYRVLAVTPTTAANAWKNSYGSGVIFVDDFGFRLSTGYRNDTAQDAASYATSMIVNALGSSSFFTIHPPASPDFPLQGDDIEALKRQGVQAIFSSSISTFYLQENYYTEDIVENRKEEFVDPETNVKTEKEVKVITGKKYFVQQQLSLTLSYAVRDISSGAVLTSGSFSGERSRDTLIGKRLYEGAKFNDQKIYSSTFAPPVNDMAEEILNSFSGRLAVRFTPTWTSESVALMDNKPKLEAVNEAYRDASRGHHAAAYRSFLSAWQSAGHVPSGYNASLMLASQGDLAGAISLMNEVSDKSGNADAYEALSTLQSLQFMETEARNQMNNTTSPSESLVTETRVFTGF